MYCLVSGFLFRLAGVYPARATGTPARACPETNDRIDIPTGRYVAELVSAHPRPRPLGSSASNARLTTSLMDILFAAAKVRTRRARLCGSFTVNATLDSRGGDRLFQTLSLLEVAIGLTRRNGAVSRQLFDSIGELIHTQQQLARAIEALGFLRFAGARHLS